jgi:protein gp37
VFFIGGTMTQTKIEWVIRKDGKQGYTWNPVYGCRNHCKYCYARRIAKRFPERFGNFDIPHLVPENLASSMPKTPSMIFVNSMSDIDYWPHTTKGHVMNIIKEHPEHRFFFLTKFPSVYSYYPFPKNCWLGVTITDNIDLHALSRTPFLHKLNKKYLSIEPLHGELPLLKCLIKNMDWIIVGAETGNRKGKITPEYSWLFDIESEAVANEIPLFEKPSLEKYGASYEAFQEFPDLWGTK